MKLFKPISNFIKKWDFFCTTQLLRYKSQPQYGSHFGGTLSIIIIIGLIITFYNKFIDCINEVSISSSSSRMISTNPTPYTISTYPQGNFMLGVEIWNHDLNAQQRYFDIVMTSVEFNTAVRNESSVEYPLEPCTKGHWERFPQAVKEFDRLHMNRWLCLPLNTTYPLQGKYTSQVSHTLQFSVKKCTNISEPLRPCAPQSQIDLFFQTQQHLLLTTYFINPLINPSSQDYLTYYLEDNYYVYFTKKLGNEGVLYMEDFEISTDKSIFPFVVEKMDTGGMVSEQVLQNIYQVPEDYDVYCSIIIFKSGVTRIYQRGFEKIDQLLSYIGGLFGTISVCLFIVSSYNTNSYQMVLGSSLFKPQDATERKTLKKYNFFSFIIQSLHDLLQMIGFKPQWKSTIEYNKCKKQMEKQLDISYLSERVLFLESAIATVLDTHQLKALHLREKLSLNQVKTIRKDFKIKRKVNKVRQNLTKMGSIEENDDYQGPKIRRFPSEPRLKNQNQIVNGSNVFLFDNQQPNHKQVYPQKFLEKVLPKSDRIQKSLKSPEVFLSQSSSDDSSESSNDGDQKQVLNQLVRLREEASTGNIMSKKIWQITNKSIIHVLPNLLTHESLIFSTLNFTSESVQNLHQAENSYPEEGDHSIPGEQLRLHELKKIQSVKEIPNRRQKVRPFKPKQKLKNFNKGQHQMKLKSLNKSLNQTEVNSYEN